MNIKIFQINMARDMERDNVKFMSYDRLPQLQDSCAINSSIYDKVYECFMPGRSLEDVYRKFNIDRPADFRGHSLSVSDVVEVTGCPDIKDGFYFCDSIGFKHVAFEPDKAMDLTPAMSEKEQSYPFIFDDELCVDDTLCQVDGYLWATDALVSRMIDVIKKDLSEEDLASVDCPNFFAVYDAKEQTISVTGTYWYSGCDWDAKGSFSLPLSDEESKALMSAMEDYCNHQYGLTCTAFINESRAEYGMELFHEREDSAKASSLDEMVRSAESRAAGCVSGKSPAKETSPNR